MKKLNKKQKLIIAIAIVLIVIILAIVITTNIISTNKNLASEGYLATTENASSNLIASYIKKGVKVGGITGTLEILDTSDADATPADIAAGKTAYVDGKKIFGTYLEEGIPIPDGFYYVGGTKDTGIIISDSLDDANKGTDKTASEYVGNQFVWVPVENPDDLFETSETGVQLNGVATTTNVYSNLTVRNGDSYTAGIPGETSKVREPDVLSSYDTSSSYADIILGTSGTGNDTELSKLFVAEYKAMSDSIKKYNGFYIGRYELTGSVDSPTEKAGVVLSADKAGNWYYLYKACQNVVQGKKNVKSTMIYGVQWDATMEWLKKTIFKNDTSKVDIDSSSWGNYNDSTESAKIDGKSGSKQNTGFSEYWKANNIYDIAGNCYEWTQEAYSTRYRVLRRW